MLFIESYKQIERYEVTTDHDFNSQSIVDHLVREGFTLISEKQNHIDSKLNTTFVFERVVKDLLNDEELEDEN